MPTDLMKPNYQWLTNRKNNGDIRSILNIPNAHIYLTKSIARDTCNVQIALNPLNLANGCELTILATDIQTDDLDTARRESVAILFDYLNTINNAIKDVLISSIVSKP